MNSSAILGMYNISIDYVYTSVRIGGVQMPKDKQINMRMSREEKRLLEKDAQGQQRSVSNLLLWCWKEWRKTSGKKGK